MNAPPFDVEASPGRLYVSGEVDMDVADTLVDAIICTGATCDGQPLVVDLGQVTFLDSSGISALLKGRQRLADNGVQLRVVNPNPSVMKVLDMAGVCPYVGLPAAAGT